jgi:hypothetical protein
MCGYAAYCLEQFHRKLVTKAATARKKSAHYASIARPCSLTLNVKLLTYSDMGVHKKHVTDCLVKNQPIEVYIVQQTFDFKLSKTLRDQCRTVQEVVSNRSLGRKILQHQNLRNSPCISSCGIGDLVAVSGNSIV